MDNDMEDVLDDGISIVLQGSMQIATGLKSTKGINAIVSVLEVNSDEHNCLCRIESTNKVRIPMLAKGGNIDGKVYGDLDMPSPGDEVLVGFVDGNISQPYIMGTIIPYLDPIYGVNNEAVNTTNKTFTKKLLEPDKEAHYKKIHKSGTTVEIMADGSAVVETPSGKYIHIDEDANKITVLGKENFSAVMDVENDAITITAKAGMTFTMDADGGTIAVQSEAGVDIAMSSTGVKVCGSNLEVLK